jgi:hypothetical protein
MEQLEAMEPCANCGRNVPEGARFCPHCAAPQAHPDLPQTAVPEEAPATEWAWCEIEWVRSFRGSVFEARPLTPEADASARSPMFRWREEQPPPETNAGARGAHEELVHALVAAGWEPVADAGPWYGEQFRRPAVTEAPEVSVERSTTRWPARFGIVALTLGSLAVIVFAVLVLLGFFVQ